MTIAPTLAIVLALHGPFISGPSVRVSPNPPSEFNKFEIRWIADFVGDGDVRLFTNPDGTGEIDGKVTPGSANDHTVDFTVGGVLTPDTTYYFKVTHTDPTGARPDLTNEPPPFPPVYTGVQAIGSVLVQPGTDSALISWDANVIGFGQVAFGITTPGDVGTVTDDLNVTNHSIELTGLSPGTTYQFRVSNLHAIDGDALASATGSFTTLGAPVPEPSAFVAWAGLALSGMVVSRRRGLGQRASRG